MADRCASASELLERAGELAHFTVLLDKAQAGRGSVVAVEGPAGIGKTGLLAAVHRLAADRGFRSLKARGRELEAGMAFSVVSQLLEPPVVAASPGERRRMLAGPGKTGAGVLGLARGAAPESEFAALHGLYWLCVNLAASRPVLLTVDDVQWADRPSLAWLGYLGRRIGELPVLLAVSLRAGDPRAREPAVTSVVSDPAVYHRPLAPLSQEGVTTLVRAQLQGRASSDFCRACWELACGNPLYVRELLAAARSDQLTGSDEDLVRLREIAPAAVGASVLARLSAMRPEAVALAGALAVLGSQTEVAIAAELAELGLAAAELAADELAAAQIFLPARPLDFFHPMMGEAVYASIGLGARRLAHRRVATILDRTGAADRVAAHLLATGPAGDPWVVDRLREAAASAHDRGAPDVAVSYLRRALAEPPAQHSEHAGLLLQLGRSEWYSGQPAAITHLEGALAEAHDVSTIAGAAGALANAYLVSDRIDAAVAVLQQASCRITPTDPRQAASLAAWAVLAGTLDDRTAPQALEVVDRWQAELDGMPDPPIRCLVAIAQVAARRNQPGIARPLVDRVLRSQPAQVPTDVRTSMIITLIGLEDFDACQKLCDETIAQARQRFAIPGLAAATSFSAMAMLQRGELADAEAQSRLALEHATGIFAMEALASLVTTLVERDELDGAAAELERIPARPESHAIMVVSYLMARGRLRTAQGRHAEALGDFLEAGERCERLGTVMGFHDWRSQAAIMQASLGQADDARTLANAEAKITRAAGLPRALGVSLRACGLIQGGEVGLDLLAEAVCVLETSQARIELARALADYGAALRRVGQRTQARAFLERALDLAHYCGARRIAARARGELVAAGAKPRREAATGRDALTPSELRVARLAAAGQTNREIAQSLFITTSTASVHLSRVYRKLGVSRRNQLATALDSCIS